MVKKSFFVTSAKTLAQCPPVDIAEVALLGRSNVGKSTLINSILNHPKLAKTSATPGKTQLINFFETIWEDSNHQNFRFRIVDLPGFGYAKVSKTIKRDWEKNLWDFLCHRSSIKLFILLIDSRHQDLEIDQEVFRILQANCKGDQEVLKVFTKCDKLNANQRNALIHQDALLMSVDEKIFKKDQGGRQKISKMILKKVFGCDYL